MKVQKQRECKSQSTSNNQFICFNCKINMNEDLIENQVSWITCENCDAWFFKACHTHDLNSTKCYVCNYCVVE